MKISADIAEKYIKGEDILQFKNKWFFFSQTGKSENIFKKPPYTNEHKKSVAAAVEIIRETAADFVPLNKEIFDDIFPNWQSELNEITAEIIVGLPQPYDAMMMLDPNGKQNIIFNAGIWADYVGKYDLSALARNLLTHEFCHVCISKRFPQLNEVYNGSDYITKLDAAAFDEGFAHMLSFGGKNLIENDFHTEKLNASGKTNAIKMLSALNEKNPEKQKELLEEAVCGSYYEKFAAICGMTYLADIWKNGGTQALKNRFNKGYSGFAAETVKSNIKLI